MTVVFNDNLYGNVRRIQEHRYNGHGIASDLKNPDFAKLADAFGLAGYCARTPAELRETLSRALEANAPALIEVPMPPTPTLGSLQVMTPLPPRPTLNL